MSNHPHLEYRPFTAVPFPERTWPNKIIAKAPIWASSDLRDGNQAIYEPMDIEKKLIFFDMLKKIGFKEIEVGYPSSSTEEYNFVRTLIEKNYIPDDVTIGVLTKASDSNIRNTMESLKGIKKAIIHVYAATAEQFRDIVFKMTKDEVKEMAVSSVKLIREIAATQQEAEWTLEFSPEAFSQTELHYAKEVCDAVVEAWGATLDNKVILNLPATVEVCSPNIYADQIEWMGKNLAKRDSVILSVHPHNDRGCAVAATEMAQLAGAERVEGCLLGNGERTGNVDIVTLALNLLTQGIDPKLDFSNLGEVSATVEACTQIPIHPRQPYAGELVHTAFSGAHQDGIKKGFACQQDGAYWNVPYLPIKPEHIGKSYEGIIRINSQSGKGGMAYLLEKNYGLVMPKSMQAEVSKAIQNYTEKTGGEIGVEKIWDIFQSEYIKDPAAAISYVGHKLCNRVLGEPQGVSLILDADGKKIEISGEGNGPINATINAFKLPIDVLDYGEKSLGKGSGAKAISIIELKVNGDAISQFGAGIDVNSTTASILAVISGVNRAFKQGSLEISNWSTQQPIREGQKELYKRTRRHRPSF